ncbi:hypothetical protein CAPTEDRAFT_128967 [Capitella teleta]|uniref:Chitin-binding type-2 domain-containing protein n=1 Tax=Capitella teleta TaxID=283909 RepID=R7TMH1_CAPTE|nr:hypothetical protein CAPTEDRAFT_128967 [Capitella teleta]|eukprot:ELT94732.1 hypothetical protein CAPTEDRAFT_128967 [Capitella teleta]
MNVPLAGLCHDVDNCVTGQKFADMTDCEFFFLCVNGLLIRRPCPVGFVFDIYERECVTPDDDFNCDYLNRKAMLLLQSIYCSRQINFMNRFADMTDCEFFFLCVNGMLIRRPCPIGFVFDIYERECVTPDDDFNCDYRCITAAPSPTTQK